jgi:hypothetical protein
MGEGAHRLSGRGGLRQRVAERPQASSALARMVHWLGWLWHGFRCHLPPLGGVRLSTRRTGGCCAVHTGGPPKTSRAARAAFVFLGYRALAPARHLRAGSVLACPGGLEWGSAGGQVVGEVLVADEIAAAICAPGLRLFGFDSLSSPLEWRRGRGPCRSSVCPEVIAAAGRPERRSLSLLPEQASASHLGSCRPAGPPMWGVVRTRGGGTGVLFVMAP